MLDAFRTGKNLAPAGTLGVSILYVAGDWAEALRLPSSGGILLEEVRRGSPAAQAGLRGGTRETVVGNYRVLVGGDLITAIEGKAVTSEDAISRAISRKHAGETLDLTILREGRSMNVKVTLGEAAESRF
jgi:S1-C subfamily serine protease